MNTLKVDSNIEWEQWGQIDPLYSVASWTGKNKDGKEPWTEEEFYRLGESDCADFLAHWKKYGVNTTSCLEIGCGAGRLTMYLPKYFKAVHAIDVSGGMIDYARKRVTDPCVRFYLTNGLDIPLPDNSVSAVFSTHVFQHFDSLSHATFYFREICRVLIPGGTSMIHLPVYNWPAMPGVFDTLYGLRKHIGDIRAYVWRRLSKLGILPPTMRGLKYPISYIYNTLPKQGFRDIVVSFFVIRSNNSVHPCVFSRKAINKDS